MYKTLKVKIVGQSPLILNNIRMANPADKIVREIAKITTKGNKKMTEADYEQVSKLQFGGCLYLNPNGPVLPNHMIEATVIAGAKKSRKGVQAKAGIVVDDHAEIVYDGPRQVEKLYEDEAHRLTCMVTKGNGKVPATRPIFPEWSAELTVKYLPDVLNESDVIEAIRNAGILCGIGDWRPRHGRFALADDLQLQKKAAA